MKKAELEKEYDMLGDKLLKLTTQVAGLKRKEQEYKELILRLNAKLSGYKEATKDVVTIACRESM